MQFEMMQREWQNISMQEQRDYDSHPVYGWPCTGVGGVVAGKRSCCWWLMDQLGSYPKFGGIDAELDGVIWCVSCSILGLPGDGHPQLSRVAPSVRPVPPGSGDLKLPFQNRRRFQPKAFSAACSSPDRRVFNPTEVK